MQNLEKAMELVARAEAIIITAGAGMGVDSGLPDYRGRNGFWNHYPLYRELGIDYEKATRPSGFLKDPEFAWGFYGHCLNLYRNAEPHEGFAAALSIAVGKPLGYFVLTSNIDGQFQKAGFDPERIHECHGSIHRLQCIHPCSRQTWDVGDAEIRVDMTRMRASPPLPRCPVCKYVARPNIFAFGDTAFIHERYTQQAQNFRQWRASLRGHRTVILECGAGTAVPGIRRFGEELLGELGDATLIRINTQDTKSSHPGVVDLISPASAALTAIAKGVL